MVAVFMRHHIALGERASPRAEPCLQLLEEPEVEIDVLVDRTVEGPDVGRRRPAAGLRLLAEDHRVGGLVLTAGLRELVRPELLDTVDVADNPAILALVCRGAGGTFLERRSGRRGAR